MWSDMCSRRMADFWRRELVARFDLSEGEILSGVYCLAEPAMLWKLPLPEHGAHGFTSCRLDQVAK